MTYEMYRNVFMICAVACGVMAVVSIFLFVLLRIPSVIGDLTGITAKRGIEQIRSRNMKTGNKKYGSSKVNRQRGKLTAKISPSGELQGRGTQGYGADTEKLQGESVNAETMLLSQSGENETTVLEMEFGVLEEITFIHTEEDMR